MEANVLFVDAARTRDVVLPVAENYGLPRGGVSVDMHESAELVHVPPRFEAKKPRRRRAVTCARGAVIS
jgi:hypothetical protein